MTKSIGSPCLHSDEFISTLREKELAYLVSLAKHKNSFPTLIVGPTGVGSHSTSLRVCLSFPSLIFNFDNREDRADERVLRSVGHWGLVSELPRGSCRTRRGPQRTRVRSPRPTAVRPCCRSVLPHCLGLARYCHKCLCVPFLLLVFHGYSHSCLVAYFAPGLASKEEFVGAFLIDQLNRAVKRSFEQTGRSRDSGVMFA
jgi:hypothetical protein